MNTIISVVIPVYNTEKYIKTTVKSILKQSFQDYEIILVDDGSTDSSPEICESLAIDHDNIRVFHTENRGAAAARNYGVDVAEGSYIAFVDSDDTVDPDYLYILYNNLIDNDADISVCGFEKINDGGKATKDKTHSKVRCMTGEKAMEKLLYQRDIMSVPWGFIADRMLWEEVRFPEGRRVEDYATIYKLFGLARRVVFSKDKLYRYYIRSTSTVFSSDSLLKNTDYYQNGREMIAYVSEKYPECLSAAYSRHFSACFQILSETKRSTYSKELIDKIYGDIKILRKDVKRDKESRRANRIAASASYISIRAIHAALICKYALTTKKVKKETITAKEAKK